MSTAALAFLATLAAVAAFVLAFVLPHVQAVGPAACALGC